jgi:hypothetical protein
MKGGPVLSFWLGCVGAAAPEVLRLYKARMEPIFLPRHYWVVTPLYLILGGIVALLLAQPNNPYSAFYVGASLPVLFGAIARATSHLESRGAPPEVEEIDVIDRVGPGYKWRHYIGLV